MTKWIVKQENPSRYVRKLDAATAHKAVEIERGNAGKLVAAARRLRDSGKRQKVLIVPSRNIKVAREAMRKVGMSGTLRNISDTYRSHIAANNSTRKK